MILWSIDLQLPPMLTVTRNSTGHVFTVTGAYFEILQWLSERLNFRCSIIQRVVYKGVYRVG